MEDTLYKNTALELFLAKITEGIDDVDVINLNSLKYAFLTGFNMGLANYESKEFKEVALKMMVR